MEKHDRHLGLPATVGKSMKEIFGFLKEMIWKRINGCYLVWSGGSRHKMACVAWKKLCLPKSKEDWVSRILDRSTLLFLLSKGGD